MYKVAAKFFKSFIAEGCIVFLLFLLINNYFLNCETTLHADGIGYYEYLPSVFIHHDLVRKDIPNVNNPAIYHRINTNIVYVGYDGYKVNKYSCGTAILELPFFTYARLTTRPAGNDTDGYQKPFQTAIFYAAIFYLFFSLFFLKKLLELYRVRWFVIIICQLLLVFATSLTNYVNFDAGFSHVYSLFAITAFLYFLKSYLTYRNLNHFLLACLLFGLILLLRQVNLIILCFVPFLAGSAENLKNSVLHLFRHPVRLVWGMLIVFALFSIQCILWYLQTGHLFIYSYPGESFNFLNPMIFRILFSYKKGLFVYTPVLFICLSGVVYLLWKKQYYPALTWIGFFLFLTYILSSWWFWSYGSSFGLRAYIEFYPVFFIPFALLLNEGTVPVRVGIVFLALLAVPVNIIQTYQYKYYILHWENMDKEIYWKVFLKTEPRFIGLAWKKTIHISQYRMLKEINLGDIDVKSNKDSVLRTVKAEEIPDFQSTRIIRVLVDNDFKRDNDAAIIFEIKEPVTFTFFSWSRGFLIHFPEKGFSQWQTGDFNFDINPDKDSMSRIYNFCVSSGKYSGKLKNVRLDFLAPR